MRSLLAIEWLKIKRYRTFWILTAFFIVLLPLWNYEISNGMINMGNASINILNQAYTFPEVWGNMGFWGSIFILFPSILIIILTTNEFGYRTHRQNVIDGWSRLQFYHAKVGMVILLSLLSTLFLFLVGIVFGLMNGGSASDIFEKFEQVAYFFLLCVDYLGFALFIGIWIKRSGLAIGLFLLYCLILENILKGIINWKLDLKLGNYLPLQSSDELLPFPLIQMAKKMMAPQTVEMWPYVIVTIVWCLIYYFAGRSMLLRSDW